MISRMTEFDWRQGRGAYCSIEAMRINYAHMV